MRQKKIDAINRKEWLTPRPVRAIPVRRRQSWWQRLLNRLTGK